MHSARLRKCFAALSVVACLAMLGFAASGTAGGTRASAGELTFARAFEPVTFNPLETNGDNGSLWDMVQIFDQLVEYVPGKFDPQPAIASSWTASEDGLSYTFKLRPIKFSNGSPLTSADVKFSIDRFINPKINPGFAFLAESIKSTSAPNPRTFSIKLKHPDAEILAALAVPVASIYPKAVFQKLGEDKFGTNPVGSGPFMLRSWTRGKSVELVRNSNYWKPGLPKLDAVHITYVPNDTTRMLQVQSGQADIAEAVPFAQIKQLDAQSNVDVRVEPIVAYDAIWLNHKVPQLSDVNVRKALAHALDLKGINRAVYAGIAEPANSTIAKTKYWTASVPAYSYDLAKAKSFLAKSKYPKGFHLSFSVPAGDTVHRSVAIIAKQAWAPLGINVTVTSQDTGALFTDYSKGKFQASIPLPVITSDVLVPDELALAWLQWTPGYQGFFTSYRNDKVGKLVQQANRATNDAKRAALWKTVQATSMNDAPWVPLFFVPARTAVRSDVNGFQTLQSGWWTLATTTKG
jgi:peptide/nickel transport system substrate-binding protein